MKAFLTLLKIDSRYVWAAVLFSVYICVQSAFMSRTDHMFSLTMNSNGSDFFLLVIPSMSMGLFFLGANSRSKSSPYSQNGIHEFLFSRAINRVQMFSSKSSIYLNLILLPLITIWAYSHVNPLVRIELPYNPPSARETVKDFYLQHFEGAYVQKDEKDKEGNKAYIVLPTGKTTIALFTVLWAVTATVLLEIVIFTVPAGSLSGGMPTLSFMILIALMTYMGWPSRGTPSRYEACLAWVSQHTFIAFMALAVFSILSQVYCCHRFVRSEITA